MFPLLVASVAFDPCGHCTAASMLDVQGLYFGCSAIGAVVAGAETKCINTGESGGANACRAVTAAPNTVPGSTYAGQTTTCITGTPVPSTMGNSGLSCEDWSGTYVTNQDECNFEGTCVPSTGWAYCYARPPPPPVAPPPSAPPPKREPSLLLLLLLLLLVPLCCCWCYGLFVMKTRTVITKVEPKPDPTPAPKPTPPAYAPAPAPPAYTDRVDYGTTPAPGAFLITAVSAANVPDLDSRLGSGTSDPYVVFSALDPKAPAESKRISQVQTERGADKEAPRTSTVMNAFNPKWKSSITLTLQAGQSALKVALWDDDFEKADDFIGKLTFPFEIATQGASEMRGDGSLLLVTGAAPLEVTGMLKEGVYKGEAVPECQICFTIAHQ